MGIQDNMTNEEKLKYREKNKLGEVILIATMLPNTESDWLRNQQHQKDELLAIEKEREYVSVVNMTDMHKSLLNAGKRYRDMTGNNINHPNDFLSRVYAQLLIKALAW